MLPLSMFWCIHLATAQIDGNRPFLLNVLCAGAFAKPADSELAITYSLSTLK